MTSADTREDLAPLRTDFDRSWRGYDARQVQEFVRRVEADLRLLISDRNAAAASAEELARQLEESRSENDKRRAKIDRISRTPIEADGLSERLLRMVELAEDESAEITERARAAAERSWAAAESAAQRLRERYERLVADVDARRRQAAEEHEELMRRTAEQVEEMTAEAARTRHRLDEQATRRREQIEADFEQAMAVRREETLRAIEKQEQEARQQAENIVAEAQRKADAADALRMRMSEQLRETQRLLQEATPLLEVEPPAEPEIRDVSGELPIPRKETGPEKSVSVVVELDEPTELIVQPKPVAVVVEESVAKPKEPKKPAKEPVKAAG